MNWRLAQKKTPIGKLERYQQCIKYQRKAEMDRLYV